MQASSAAAPPLPDEREDLPRFYVQDRLPLLAAGALVRLPEEEARHATRTLRLRDGDAVELCDGAGAVVRAQLVGGGGSARRGASVDVGARLAGLPTLVQPAGWQWVAAVACGSLKGGRSDWLVEKLAELGAAALLPLRTERSPAIGGGEAGLLPVSGGKQRAGARPERRGGGEEEAGSSGREDRWARVAAAAMKQCLRPHAMAVLPPADVGQLCQRIREADAAFVGVAGAPPLAQVAAASLEAHASGSSGSSSGCDRGERSSSTPVGLLIVGPEGDFTPEERAALAAAGARAVGLGPLRLRAETAAVAALAYLRLRLDGGDPA